MTQAPTLERPVAPAAPTREPMFRRRRRLLPAFSGAWYILPSLAFLVVIVLLPIAMTFYYSFTSYSVLGSPRPVGLENYRTLLADSSFRAALVQTGIYTVISVPLQTVVALLVANVIARRFRNRWGGFARSALFVPVMSSMVLVGTVWRFILSTDDGALNGVLGLVGIAPVNWLGQPGTALLSVALVTVWKNIGYFLVIYYAGIMDVPADLYEASALDGAGSWGQFWHITVPSLRHVTFLVVILGTIWSFQVFDLVYTMTGGGPGGGTVTIVLAIYEAGFQNFNMGYASAMAMALFIIVLLVSIVQRVLLNRK